MAQSYGYSSVSEQGFVSFEKQLASGRWQSIETTSLVCDTGVLPDNIEALPVVGVCKLRATQAIATLVKVLAGQSNTDVLDAVWDRLQTRLDAELNLKLTDDDPAVVSAAGRARKSLLAGNGTAQNNFLLRDEIDFGRTQVRLAATQPLSDDVALLGIAPTIARIGDATEALAQAVEPGVNGERATARSRQIRAAWTGCVAAFNGIHDQLVWILESMAPGPGREEAAALLVPFERLLEDHKSRAVPSSPRIEKTPSDPIEPTG